MLFISKLIESEKASIVVLKGGDFMYSLNEQLDDCSIMGNYVVELLVKGKEMRRHPAKESVFSWDKGPIAVVFDFAACLRLFSFCSTRWKTWRS